MNNQLFQNSPMNLSANDSNSTMNNLPFLNQTLVNNLSQFTTSNSQSTVSRPKGPLTAYSCFVQVIKEEHRRKHPQENVIMSEFTKKCGEKWKQMTLKERKRFEEMALMGKDRYQINEFPLTSNGPFGVISSSSDTLRRRKRKRTKDPGMPKRAWSAFFFFSHELRPVIREEHPDWRVSDVAKELGKRWEDCQDKSKYEAQAQADRQRYEEEMIQYKNGNYVPGTGKHRLSNEGTSTPGPHGDDFFDEEEEGEEADESILSVSGNPVSQQNSSPNQNGPVEQKTTVTADQGHGPKSSEGPTPLPTPFDALTLANPRLQAQE